MCHGKYTRKKEKDGEDFDRLMHEHSKAASLACLHPHTCYIRFFVVEMQLGVTKFPVGKWVLDRIGHALSHCSTERPIGAGIIYHFPASATTQALEHFIYVTIKRTPLHLCLLSFAWLYMDSMDMLFMGGLGTIFIPIRPLYFNWGPPLLLFDDKRRLFCFPRK